MDRAIAPDVYPGTFQHEPLPDAARYIRLLEVLDDKYSAATKIRCRMTTWSIEKLPQYYAISYTWGDPESNTTILVNDQALGVRTNCEFVLKQVYRYKTGRYYWVDAICIDQTNYEEKGTQVSIMGQIYQQAFHVLASVGDHADDSRLLFQRFQKSFAVWILGSDEGCRMVITMARSVAFIRRYLWAAVNFTQRAYFGRLWILQEQKLAKEVTFLCGADTATREVVRGITTLVLLWCDTMSFEVPNDPRRLAARMRKPLPLLSPEHHLVPKRHGLITNEKDAQDLRQSLLVNFHIIHFDVKDIGVIRLLTTARGLQCADKKDKLYGIISLLDWGPTSPVVPNYTKKDLEVATDFVLAISRLSKYRQMDSLLEVSEFTRQNLGLNHESDGVHDAIEARCGPPIIPVANLKGSTTAMADLQGLGFIVHGEDLSKSSEYTTWTASKLSGWEVYLPPWVKHGDFIVFSERHPNFSIPIVVRLVPFNARGNFLGYVDGLTIGHGFHERWMSEMVYEGEPERRFVINWDVEDQMIFDTVTERLINSEKYSPQWISALNTAVCRKETPVSSYVSSCLH